MSTKRDEVAQLRAELQAGDLWPAYLFHGEEGYLKAHYVGEVEKALEARFGPADRIVLEQERFALDRFFDATENLTFGCAARLVVLKGVEPEQLSKEDREAVMGRIGDLPEGVTVLFVAAQPAADTPAARRKRVPARTVSPQLHTVEFPLQKPAALRPWMSRRLAAQGLAISAEVSDYLLGLCGHRMSRLAAELHKLAALCRSEGATEVQRRHVDDIALPENSADVYEIVGLMTARRYDEALKKLDRCKQNREDPVHIAVALGNAYAELLAVKAAYDAGQRNLDRMMADFKIRPTKRYFMNQYLRESAHMDIAGPMRAVSLLSELDRRLKQSAADPWELLEEALIRLRLQGVAK
ncbi:MAG: hypothetical protein GXX99_05070 [Clostridiales bacterium]|nr:hypothetical protein [Clostridiales bacterium]